MITSRQNEKVKLANALQTRAKTRRKEGKIVLEGLRLVQDALQQGQSPDFILYEPEALAGETLATLEKSGVALYPVAEDVMQYVSDTQQPQGIVGVFPLPVPALPSDPQRVLILDAVRDPGNLGTIFRAGAAAGVQAILLSPTCVDAYNPKALRSGMGAHFRVPVVEMTWDRIAVYCRSLAIYLADAAGELSHDAVDWSAGWALIIGSEAHGAGREAEQLAQQRVFIPMAAATESLNAAIAAAVILFEAARQGWRKT